MSRNRILPMNRCEALEAKWNLKDEAEGFVTAVLAGKWDLAKVRADIGVTDAEVDILHQASTGDKWTLRRIDRIIARRRLTLEEFDRQMAHIQEAGGPERDLTDTARAGVRAGPSGGMASPVSSQPHRGVAGLLFPELDPGTGAPVRPLDP